MKYKSCSSNSIKPKAEINNMITTFNLKIKDIHILLDDIDTNRSNNNIYVGQKRHSTKIFKNKNSKEFLPSPFHKKNSNKNKIYYHKRNFDSLRHLNKPMKTIPTKEKRDKTYINNLESPPSLSTTEDLHNNSSSITKRNLSQINTDRIIYYKKNNTIQSLVLNNPSSLGKKYFNNNNSSQVFDSNKKKISKKKRCIY